MAPARALTLTSRVPALPRRGRLVPRAVTASLVVLVSVVAALLLSGRPALADDSVTVYPGLVAAGPDHTCGILTPGQVSCWGRGDDGRLGYGSTDGVADGIGPSVAEAGSVPVGGAVTQVAVGDAHSCALLDDGGVRCWGRGDDGRLGYAARGNVGDGSGPSIRDAGDLPLPGPATQIAASGATTCALLATGDVSCWGRLAPVHAIALAGAAVAVAAGDDQSCAVLQSGAVDCWAPDGTPQSLTLDGTAQDVAVGSGLACALLDSGEVECWSGGAAPAPVQLGPAAVAVAVGGSRACAVADDAGVWCWTGQAAPTSEGVSARAVSVGDDDACIITTGSALSCWGSGAYGKLGTGDVGSREPDGSVVGAVKGSPLKTVTQSFGGTTQADAAADARGIAVASAAHRALWWWLLALPVAGAAAAAAFVLRRRTTGGAA